MIEGGRNLVVETQLQQRGEQFIPNRTEMSNKDVKERNPKEKKKKKQYKKSESF